MPLYYFSTKDGERYEDDTGTALPDDAAARAEAIAFAGALVRDDPQLLSETGELRVLVTDEAGRHVWTVCVRVEPGRDTAGPT